jgi:acyl-coenzyme A thioesterase PaaI-like protein
MPDAPPELHADERAYFLATMGLEYHLEGGGGHGRATITDYLTAAPGWPSTAVILTFADVLIGVAASTRTAPRISVTSSLSVYLTGPLPGGGDIELVCHLTKSGRTVTVGETVIRSRADGRLLGAAVGTFQASPRPQDTVSPLMVQSHRVERVDSPHPTLADHVGLEVVEPGRARIALRPDLLNGTQSLQGGLVALLGESAAQSAATAALGAPAVVDTIEVNYLSAARVGPIEARAEPIGRDLYRVTAHDPGMDDRIVCLIMARTRPAGGESG